MSTTSPEIPYVFLAHVLSRTIQGLRSSSVKTHPVIVERRGSEKGRYFIIMDNEPKTQSHLGFHEVRHLNPSSPSQGRSSSFSSIPSVLRSHTTLGAPWWGQKLPRTVRWWLALHRSLPGILQALRKRDAHVELRCQIQQPRATHGDLNSNECKLNYKLRSSVSPDALQMCNCS